MAGELPDGFLLDGDTANTMPPGGMSDLPQGYTVNDVQMPPLAPSGPTGNFINDATRRITTDVINAGAGLTMIPHMAAGAIDWLGKQAGVNPNLTGAITGKHLFPATIEDAKARFTPSNFSPYEANTPLGQWADRITSDVLPAVADPASIPAVLGGSITADMAQRALPDHPLLGATLGFIPGALAGTAIARGGAQIGGAIAGKAMNPTMQAYERLGIPTDLAGDVTGNRGLQYMQNIAAGKPGSDNVVAQASQDAVDGWRAALDRTALKLGKATTAQEAGTSLVTAANDWLDQFRKKSNDLWGNFRLQVPGDTEIPVPGFQANLNSVLGDFGTARALATALQPGMARTLQGALAKEFRGPVDEGSLPTLDEQRLQNDLGREIGGFLGIAQEPKPLVDPAVAAAEGGKTTLPWKAVQETRRRLGELMENGPQSPDVADMGQAALKRLYTGLSQDMENGAASVSPDALASFNKASAYTRTGHQILDNNLSPILAAGKAGTPEKAAQTALAQVRLGGSNVSALGQAIPQGAGDLASYQLHNLAGGEQNPVSFATAIGGKRPAMSPEATQAMFGPVAQDVADLQTTGQAMKNTAAVANHSNTAAYLARDPSVRLMTGITGAMTGHEAGGLPGAIVGGLGSYFGPLLAGKLAQKLSVNPAISRLYSYAPLTEFHTPTVSLRLPFIGGPQVPFSPAPLAVMAGGRTSTPTP